MSASIQLTALCDASLDLKAQLNEVNFTTRFTHPVYGHVGDFFYPIIHQKNWLDHSFVISKDGIPHLWVSCGSRGGRLSHYGFPVRFFWHKDSAPDRKTIQQAIDHLLLTRQTNRLTHIWIAGDAQNNELGLLDKACLDRGGQPTVRFNALMDLSRNETGLRMGLRKSYKSLINWGKRTFNMIYLNAENLDQELFNQFIQFYNKVAGKDVHNASTWNALFHLIGQGQGEISLAFTHEGQMVAGSTFIDEGGTSLYFIAAYEREMFDKPIGHWPVFDAALRAKARGNRWMDLGEFYPHGVETPKDQSIGFFKKGFSDIHRMKMTWQL